MRRRALSRVPIARSSAESAGEARPDTASIVSEPRASVFLEHNLVSAVILATALAAVCIATSTLGPLGTWWTRAVAAVSRTASG